MSAYLRMAVPWRACSAARRGQDFLHFFEQLRGAVGFWKNFESRERFAQAKTIVIEEASDDQNFHFQVFGPQVHGGIVSGQALDIAADDQQIGRNLPHTLYR